MSHLLSKVLNRKYNIFGESLPLAKTASLHFQSILSNFEGQFMLPYGFGLDLFIAAVVIILYINKSHRIVLSFFAFLLFTLLFFTITYRHELKEWYLYAIRVWYCFIVGLGLEGILKLAVPKSSRKYLSKRLSYNVVQVFVVAFVLTSFVKSVANQNSYIKDNGISNNPKCRQYNKGS